ncbi:DUF302 domain-containing protein [Paraburkholderia sp.]|uniref:DUF302 domain-containing protein n=1 Tax=Paraburkholderia sp. TaxID=1926495 RepID=UPI0025F679A4|nr:DUF302 domain-containing protein [Paraburkholderia sp.]
MTGHEQFPASVLTFVSAYDVDTTLAKLKTALTTAGAVVFADVDQRAAAAQVGLQLRRTRFILFGNPKAGTPVMAANPHAALELPLRLVVWEDDERRTHVDYYDVARPLTGLYGIPTGVVAPLLHVPTLLQEALQ